MINNITDLPTPRFGEVRRNQVEERLTFCESGAPPSKNADAMKKAFDQLKLDEQANMDVNVEKPEKKKKKRKSDAMDVDEVQGPTRKKLTKAATDNVTSGDIVMDIELNRSQESISEPAGPLEIL